MSLAQLVGNEKALLDPSVAIFESNNLGSTANLGPAKAGAVDDLESAEMPSIRGAHDTADQQQVCNFPNADTRMKDLVFKPSTTSLPKLSSLCFAQTSAPLAQSHSFLPQSTPSIA